MENTLQVNSSTLSQGSSMKVDKTTIFPDKNQCAYTSCYCEENVWKLCEYIRDKFPPDILDDYFVVFISNPQQETVLWKQKAGRVENDFFVVWDYHVVLIDKEAQLVFDLDSTVAFPSSFNLYLQSCIRNDCLLLEERFHRRFRVIGAKQYLEIFASDRSRMKHPDGSFIKPPPNYPCIQTELSHNNLDDFIDMTESLNVVSSVSHLLIGTEEFRKFFTT